MSNLAKTFHDLHAGPQLLRLPNAWDAGSARLIASLGASAIATTSAGVAWAHGYPDGDALPPNLVIATAAAIARSVPLPVTIDFEGGFSPDPYQVASLAAQLVDAGVVGINIEDAGGNPELLCAKIAAIRARCPELFINARTDVYLRGLGAAESRPIEATTRAARYAAAGASGIFVPGVTSPSDIAQLTRGTSLPVNVLAWPGLPAVSELQRLGVRRLSAGSSIAEAAFGRAASLAAAFLTGDASTVDGSGALSYRELNQLSAR